jgi:hypothetical protein
MQFFINKVDFRLFNVFNYCLILLLFNVDQ